MVSKYSMSGYVTTRLYADSHTIVKAMAGFEGTSMVDFLDRIIREEAERKGFVLREDRSNGKMEMRTKEIVLSG
jgi:hypothetical protein